MSVKNFVFTAAASLLGSWVFAQTTINTMPSTTPNNNSAVITFEIATNQPIVVTGMTHVFAASAGTTGPVEIWYRQGGVLAAGQTTPSITSANGWMLFKSTTATSAGNTTAANIPFGSDVLTLPAGTTFGVCINATGTLGSRYMTWLAGTPSTFVNGGVSLNTMPNGFGGTLTGWIPSRAFCGSITYLPQTTCSGIPSPGLAGAVPAAVCLNQTANLMVTGATFSGGLTFQWQKATSASGPWVPIPGATSIIATVSQSVNTWYRCEFTCANGGGVAESSPVLVTTLPGITGGNYTVDPTGSGPSNFTSLNAAISAMSTCGIAGPITLNIQQGVHAASLLLTDFPGSSPVNKITFTGAPNWTTSIVNVPGGGAVFTLNGAKNIVLQNLKLVNNSGSVIRLTNNADSIRVENNLILSDTTSSALINAIFSYGVLVSPNTMVADVDYLTIKNNIIKGANCAIAVNGVSSTNLDQGFLIEGNTLLKQLSSGMKLSGLEDVLIKNNRFDQSRSSTSMGLQISQTRNVDIEGNIIMARSTGLRLEYPNFGVSATIPENLIANNMFKGDYAGMYGQSLRFYKIYHNTFVGGTYGYLLTGDATGINNVRNLDNRNNIFVGNTLAYYQSNSLSNQPNMVLDYNAYQAGTGGLAYNSGTHATLTAWQSALPSFNAHSVSGSLQFLAPNDLHIGGVFPNNLGLAGLGVTVDIDGQVRPAAGSSAPDMGADEFSPIPYDAHLVGLVGAVGGCSSTTTPISVLVENLGANAITSLPIQFVAQNATGGTPQVLSIVASVSIPSLGTDTVAVGTINTHNGGLFNFKASTYLPNDGQVSNDSISLNSVRYHPLEPNLGSNFDTVCPGQDSIWLFAVPQPGVVHSWFGSAAGGNSLATGDSVSLPTTQNTYYLEIDTLQAVASIGNGTTVGQTTLITPYKTQYADGRVQYLIRAEEMAAAGALAGSINSIAFDVALAAPISLTDFTIKMGTTSVSSLSSYLPNSGFTTVYNNPTYAPFVGWNVHTFSTPFSWNGSDNVIVEVCFNNFTYTASSLVYYHTTSYPSVFDGYANLISASGCTPGTIIGSAQSNRPNMQFNISYAPCLTPRKPVSFLFNPDVASAVYTATETTPGTFMFNASGSNGDFYEWSFPGGSGATGLTATHTFPAPGGPHWVTLEVLDSTCMTIDSVRFQVSSTIGFAENSVVQNFFAYPNPTNGWVTLVMEVNKALNFRMEFINDVGQVVAERAVETAAGRNEFPVDLHYLAKGVYTVRVLSQAGEHRIRLVLQ